jgi:hypothetical protein
MFHSGSILHWGDRVIFLAVCSVEGKLYLDFGYVEPLLSQESAKKIVQEFMSILDSVISEKL